MSNYNIAIDIDPSKLNGLIYQKELYDILSFAVEIRLFDRISEISSKAMLSKSYGFDPYTLELFLKVLIHSGYIEEKNGALVNSDISKMFLSEKSSRNMISAFSSNNKVGTILDYMKLNAKDREEPEWSEERLLRLGNAALNGAISNLLDSVCLDGRQTLLDLGGGHGFYSMLIALKYPDLKITIQDLPNVVSFSQKIINKLNFQERIEILPLDFMKEEIKGRYDAVLCSNVLHYDKIDTTLPKVYNALNPNGLFILRNRVSDHIDNLENSIKRFFWHAKGGRVIFSTEDWEAMLTKYGFLNTNVRSLYEISAVMTAVKII